jgi:hypothetical protein
MQMMDPDVAPLPVKKLPTGVEIANITVLFDHHGRIQSHGRFLIVDIPNGNWTVRGPVTRNFHVSPVERSLWFDGPAGTYTVERLVPQSADGEQMLNQARELLTGPRKDLEGARNLLLDAIDRKLPHDKLSYAYVYLGYIEDRSGNREAAMGWFQETVSLRGADSGIVEVARHGLREPVTWIRHLDRNTSPSSVAPPPRPASAASPRDAFVTSDPPTGLIPAANLTAQQRRDNFEALWRLIDTIILKHHIWKPQDPGQRFSDNRRSELIYIAQHPLGFEHDRLPDPDTLRSKQSLGNSPLPGVIVRQDADDDISIDREHVAALLPSLLPRSFEQSSSAYPDILESPPHPPTSWPAIARQNAIVLRPWFSLASIPYLVSSPETRGSLSVIRSVLWSRRLSSPW